MRNSLLARAALAVLVAVVTVGAGAPEAHAQYSRKSPIVEAVQKTREAIVTVKVEKRGSKEVVGTGVVLDERGVVVTNRHVIANADRVTARLFDGTVVAARVHVEAASHDLAVLKLSTDRRLKALKLYHDADLMVGETVIAVGNPFGYTNSVTTGIISALGREITMPGNVVLRNLIQVNASINPGNSGGPLLNINGELIGINVAIREGAQGIAFALNAATVDEVLSKLLSAGNVANLNHGLATRVELVGEADAADRQRVVVAAVASRSPAARAGLKTGDVLTHIGDRPVANRFDVERALWSHKPGDKIETTVLRDGEETQLALTLAPSGESSTSVAQAQPGRGATGRGNARPVRTPR